MKKLILLMLFVLPTNVFAQDTVKRSSDISNFTERFMVLKSDKKVRHGSYKLLNSDGKIIASGKYDQGKRTGIWNFYTNGLLVQQYDYTNNKIIYNFPDKSKISYEVPGANPGDSVMAPVKVGGYTAGFKLMVQNTDYFKNINGLTGNISLDHLISLNENGKIVLWMLRIKNNDIVKMKRISFANVPEEDGLFLPAAVNGKASVSTIIFHEELSTLPGYTTTELIGVRQVVGTATTTGSGSTTRTTVVTGVHP